MKDKNKLNHFSLVLIFAIYMVFAQPKPFRFMKKKNTNKKVQIMRQIFKILIYYTTAYRTATEVYYLGKTEICNTKCYYSFNHLDAET